MIWKIVIVFVILNIFILGKWKLTFCLLSFEMLNWVVEDIFRLLLNIIIGCLIDIKRFV